MLCLIGVLTLPRNANITILCDFMFNQAAAELKHPVIAAEIPGLHALPGLSAVKPRSSGSQVAGCFIKQARGWNECIADSQRRTVVGLTLRGASPAGRAPSRAGRRRFDGLWSAAQAQGSEDAHI